MKIKVKKILLFFLLLITLNANDYDSVLDLQDDNLDAELLNTQPDIDPYQEESMKISHPGMGERPPESGFRGGRDMGMRRRMGGPDMGMGMGMGQQPQQTPQVNQEELELTTLEIIFISITLLFFINAFIGKQRNYNIAKNWYYANKEFLFNNYAHIGVISEKKKEAIALMKESYRSYKVYASGRVNIKYLNCIIDLKHRHDIIMSFLGIFLSDEDRVTFEFSLDLDISTVFVICNKKDRKWIEKSYMDVEFFTSAFEPKYLSEKNILLAENTEIVSELFNFKQVLNSFRKVEEHLGFIYYTDKNVGGKDNKETQSFNIFFSFSLKKMNSQIYTEVTQFVHLFVDQFSQYRLPANFKKEAEVKRVEFEKLKLKERLIENKVNPDQKISMKKKGKK